MIFHNLIISVFQEWKSHVPDHGGDHHRHHLLHGHHHPGDGGLERLVGRVLLPDDGVGGGAEPGERRLPELDVRPRRPPPDALLERARARQQYQRHLLRRHQHRQHLPVAQPQDRRHLLLPHRPLRPPRLLRHLLRPSLKCESKSTFKCMHLYL